MSGHAGASRARAFRCTSCTRLTITLNVEALRCEHCDGPVTEIQLRHRR